MASTLQQETPAHLHHLHIVSPEPERLIAFYQEKMELQPRASDDGRTVLVGPGRAVEISHENDGVPAYSGYALDTFAQLDTLRARLMSADVECLPASSVLYQPGAFSIADPQGRRVAFGLSALSGPVGKRLRGAPARLQHTVYQTTELECIVRFYVEKVGFAISDEAVDEDGTPMVVFMRSDDEHHSLAFFRGSQNEWDHHCYETNEWNDIRDWGDRFAAAEVPIFFGPGRHGPGNNLFFMVTDPDGNRLEFSAELQHVAANAEPGVWPHGERTLNSWGRAWVRT
ncbi:VOC family protein [Paraburkholderia sediminicola]|uniref:VOC family protein n=1 Tax=Paraburkholderia sediminicola TaxID=458836 RepID=UPI0038B6EB99